MVYRWYIIKWLGPCLQNVITNTLMLVFVCLLKLMPSEYINPADISGRNIYSPNLSYAVSSVGLELAAMQPGPGKRNYFPLSPVV